MRLDDYLREHKLTQAQLGAKLNPPVSQAQVSQWVRGITRVTLEQALQIDGVTGGLVSPAECAALYTAREVGKEPAAV
jgi:DNA-binding transcriptional regulator YdaS (Cro superfamily)